MRPKSLTVMQQRYIWLMGSFPELITRQGRGIRGGDFKGRLLYAKTDEILYLFGYSDPLYSLRVRGLVRRLQDNQSYDLTDEGNHVFRQMLTSQMGIDLNAGVKEGKLKDK